MIPTKNRGWPSRAPEMLAVSAPYLFRFLSDGPVHYRDIGNAYDVGVDMNSLVFVFQTDENNFSYIKKCS